MILHNVEQGTEDWLNLRIGVPTASNFGRLVTGTGKPSKSLGGYAAELASELFAGKSITDFDGQFEGSNYTSRGKDLEQEAVDWYGFTYDCEIERPGFITTDDGLAGCSPDGIISGVEGLEIKTLKAENHIAARTYFAKHGHAEPKYTPQVQGGLWVTGFSKWTLLFYNRDLPPLVVPIAPDPAYHESLAKAVKQVCAERDEILASLRREQQEVPRERSSILMAG